MIVNYKTLLLSRRRAAANYQERFIEDLWLDLLSLPNSRVYTILDKKKILAWMPDRYYTTLRELVETVMGNVCKVPITLHSIDNKTLITFFRNDPTGLEESMCLFRELLDEWENSRVKLTRRMYGS